MEVAKERFTTETSALQPPAVSEIRGDTKYPYFDRLAQFGSVEAQAGKVLERPIVVPVELSRVPDSVETLAGASNAMQHAVYACTLLANQAGLVRDSYALRLALVSHLFLRVLPPPLPPNSTSRCFWASLGSSITSDTQSALLKWLNRVHIRHSNRGTGHPTSRSPPSKG